MRKTLSSMKVRLRVRPFPGGCAVQVRPFSGWYYYHTSGAFVMHAEAMYPGFEDPLRFNLEQLFYQRVKAKGL